jgi:hypothetical protein
MSSFYSSTSDLQSAISDHSYSIPARISLGRHYKELGYPDLAAGEAYLALLLIDEFDDKSGEWHENVVEAVAEENGLNIKDNGLSGWERET